MKIRSDCLDIVPIRKLVIVLTPALCGVNLILLMLLLSKNYNNVTKRDASSKDINRSIDSYSAVHRQPVPASIRSSPCFNNMALLEKHVVIHPESMAVRDRDVTELKERKVPNMFFYVWCGHSNRTFEFQHYLSIMSVWYVFEPDLIELRYESLPKEDKYNTWFTRLRSHIPAFNALPLPTHIKGPRCSSTHGLEIVYDRGGMYVQEETVFTIPAYEILFKRESFAVNSNFQLAFVASIKRNQMIGRLVEKLQNTGWNNGTKEKIRHIIATSREKTINCISSDLSNELSQQPEAVCVKFKKPCVLKDILSGKPDLTWLKRMLYHRENGTADDDNSQNIKRERHEQQFENQEWQFDRQLGKEPAFPWIVHYVWFGMKPMTFSMFLSFLSTVHIVKPAAIFLHGDLQLTGPYWDQVRTHPLVHLVYREPPTFIFGKRVLYMQHRSDVVRADLLDKYGGIYMDWDAYWLRSPAELLQNHHQEVILSRDHMPRLHFPDTINMGVVMARPRSKFIRAWRSALVDYQSCDFLYNAVELPYKIYEMFPDGVYISDRLQVMCYYLKCHPTFDPDFKHWGRAQPFDWRKDVYAIHFTHPDPPSFDNETALQTFTGMFADIGRCIWNLHITETGG